MNRSDSASKHLTTMLSLYVPVMLVSPLWLPLGIGFIALAFKFWPLLFFAFALLVFGYCHVGIIALMVVPRDKPGGPDWFETKLPREQLAKLYDFVHDIAEKNGLPEPDGIRLGSVSTAHVYESNKGKRILVIGGVALAALNRDALGAIIAHELAHFHHGDTTFDRKSSWSLRLMRTLSWQMMIGPKHWIDPMLWPLAVFQVFTEMAFAASSRTQEFAADAWSAEHAGKEVVAAALIYIHVVERMSWANFADVVRLAAEVGHPSGEVFTEQARRAQSTTPEEWRKYTGKELKVNTKTFDSHPCLRERLDAIEATSEEGLRQLLNLDGYTARSLVAEWKDAERKMSITLTSAWLAMKGY